MKALVQSQIEDLRTAVHGDMVAELGYDVEVRDSTEIGDMVFFRLYGLQPEDLSSSRVQDVFNASFNHHLARVTGMGSDN